MCTPKALACMDDKTPKLECDFPMPLAVISMNQVDEVLKVILRVNSPSINYMVYVQVSSVLCCVVLQERNLALHSEGIKMTLASEMPHLLAIDNDVYGGGIIIYHLKVISAADIQYSKVLCT